MIAVTVRHNDNYADIEFPCGDSYLQAKLMELRANDPNVALYVSEVKEPEELTCLKDHFVNPDELNFLAKRLDSFVRKELDQFYMAAGKTGKESLKDLINLTYNLNHFTLVQDVSSTGKIGRAYVLNTEGVVPADDEDNPIYAQVGKELIDRGFGVITEKGLLIYNPLEKLEEVYDGTVFPPFDWHGNSLLEVQFDYNGKSETLFLPDDSLAIKKAVSRLGALSVEDCSIGLDDIDLGGSNWMERIEAIVNEEGIYAANNLLQTLSSGSMDWDKLSAVMEYTDVSDAKSIAALAENPDAFGYAKGVEDNEGLGRWWIENHDELQLSIELEDYFDYDQYGEEIHREHSGEFLADSGYVFMEYGYRIEDILDTDEDESMTMGGI